MVNWQITATTIYCEAVVDEVTLMVYKDGSAKCTGYVKHGESGGQATRAAKAKGKQGGQQAKCDGSRCPRPTAYRDRLFAEESGNRGRQEGK